MKWVFGIFLVLYLCAVAIFLIGTLGWFGQDRDPLAGVFLMPLGIPWNFIADRLGMAGVWVGLLSPLLNIAILFWLWRRV